MRYRAVVVAGLLFTALHARAYLGGADQVLPLKGGRPIVATVNDETISLDEFARELDPDRDLTAVLQGYGTAKDLELLDRLVNIRLIVAESATMGLADDPEIRKQVEVTARAILRDMFMATLVKGVKADPAAVDTTFKELVREWKIESLIFQDEATARRVRDEIANGATFATVAARESAAKKAAVDTDTDYHQRKDYLPPIAEAIASLQVGQVGPVVHIDSGFVVLTVTDIRYPDKADALTEARKRTLSQAQNEVLQAHDKAMKSERAAIDRKMLDSIDYAAEKPGIDALLADRRVVAELKGAAPVTVADLTDFLRMQSFHGTDRAGQGTRMNAAKENALDATIGRRLLNAEARTLGLDKTPEYEERVRAYEDSLVFSSFIQKVIVPDSKMTEEEVQKYYAEHVKDFSSPEMVRIRSLVFKDRGAAEDAMSKLRDGADFGWLLANAEGQADKATPGLLIFDGRLVTTDSMPPDLQKVITGGKAGEYKLYPGPEALFYVLSLQAVVAQEAKPYDGVHDEIAKKLYGQKLKKNVDAYLAKLRAASTIEVHLKKAQ